MSTRSIHEAAREGDIKRVTKLLNSDPTLANQDDQHNWRPIFHAALYKHFDVVQALIDHGADLSALEGSVMHYAGEVPGNKPVVELLVKYGALDAHAEPKSEQARQFIYAVFLANEGRVRTMLKDQPGLAQERYARGDIALHHACRNGDTAIVEALLEHGAKINALSNNSHFPLYCAAGHCHVETTAYLLDYGADPNQSSNDGTTVIEFLEKYIEHASRYRQCLELVESAKNEL